MRNSFHGNLKNKRVTIAACWADCIKDNKYSFVYLIALHDNKKIVTKEFTIGKIVTRQMDLNFKTSYQTTQSILISALPFFLKEEVSRKRNYFFFQRQRRLHYFLGNCYVKSCFYISE